MKKILIQTAVNKLSNISKKSIGVACVFVFNQPKEPKALQKFKI